MAASFALCVATYFDPPEPSDLADIAITEYKEILKFMKKNVVTLAQIKEANERLKRLNDAFRQLGEDGSAIKQLPEKIAKQLEQIKAQIPEAMQWLKRIKDQLPETVVKQLLSNTRLDKKILEKCYQSWQFATRLCLRNKPKTTEFKSEGRCADWQGFPEDILKHTMTFFRVHEITTLQKVCKEWNAAGKVLYKSSGSHQFGQAPVRYIPDRKVAELRLRLLKPPKTNNSKESKNDSSQSRALFSQQRQ